MTFYRLSANNHTRLSGEHYNTRNAALRALSAKSDTYDDIWESTPPFSHDGELFQFGTMKLDRASASHGGPSFDIGEHVRVFDATNQPNGDTKVFVCRKSATLDSDVMLLDRSDVELGEFAVVEYASFFAVRHNPTGLERAMSDGVDAVFDADDNPLSPGTDGFVDAWSQVLNAEPSETRCAYFDNELDDVQADAIESGAFTLACDDWSSAVSEYDGSDRPNLSGQQIEDYAPQLDDLDDDIADAYRATAKNIIEKTVAMNDGKSIAELIASVGDNPEDSDDVETFAHYLMMSALGHGTGLRCRYDSTGGKEIATPENCETGYHIDETNVNQFFQNC